MKTYFIGLGGAGLNTVAELSRRLSKEQNYAEDYAFTYIDTDAYTRDYINHNGIVIPVADYVDLGTTIPISIYKAAEEAQPSSPSSKRFMEWAIPQTPGHMVLPSFPLTDSATAQRMIGRIGLYNFYHEVERELTAKISRFNELQPDDNGRQDVDIWVVASSCGGTGSAILLDVLYMINRIANPIAHGAPNVKLVLYMPQAFVQANATNPNHKLNAYACLEEINFFRSNYENGNGKTYEAFAVRPSHYGNEIYDFPLYRYIFPICAENNVGSKMKISQFYPTIAETIFILNTGRGQDILMGLLSNIMEEVKQTRLPGITNQMIGYGFRAVKKANKELKEYMTRRALYEVVNYGLLDKTEPANFDQLTKEFAQNAILKNLFSIFDSIHESDREYKYDNVVDSQSIEMLVKLQLDNQTKYDPSKVNADVVRSMSKRLDDALNGEAFNQTKEDIFALITSQIDVALNTFIHKYGLNHAFYLLNQVDDHYLEPLYNHIITTLLPSANRIVAATQAVCANFMGRSWLSQKFTRSADIHQYIQQYKYAVARAITLRLSMEIIRDLTERSTGYLEKLRKGDFINYAGIRNIQKLLEYHCVDLADDYANLAKKFRATADDTMTVYFPSLAELTTGEVNADWAPNNIFDQLYQQSILEQKEIEVGMEKEWIPVRISEVSRGLADILERLDPNNNLFIKIIKDKQIDIETNCATKIIEGIHRVVEALVNADNTPAACWLQTGLSEAIHQSIPSALNRQELFDAFINVEREAVLFPMREDLQTETYTKLLFIGESQELAKEFGYNPMKRDHLFFYDCNKDDYSLTVVTLSFGLSFDMYKYYPQYKAFYESEISDIRHYRYGCHIHRAFNEHGVEYFRTHSVEKE